MSNPSYGSSSPNPYGPEYSEEPGGHQVSPYAQPQPQPYQQPYGQAYQDPQAYGASPYPPQPYQQQYYAPVNAYAAGSLSAKSKTAGGLLGIFLGAFGVHNFYLGHSGKGIAQLLITLLSFGLLSPISAIWGLIEGIMILASNPQSPWGRDSDGRILQ